jgi:GDP-mannose 6-dehydrogenase
VVAPGRRCPSSSPRKQIPHLSSLLCETIDEVLDKSDVIGVGNAAPEFADALKKTTPEQVIVDLVRVKTDRAEIPGQYQGICW